MTYDEMNSFILNYLKNDITGRAVMLSGEWGSGKSYYVKTKLKSFLEDKDNGKYKCVIVSLYGLSDTSEISKAIYTELRSFKFKKKNEVLTTAGVAASVVPKTVFNAMTSRVGYDIGQVSDKQMQKVYDSINLNKKLLVLEDIERTQIDIIELLGYINNMCENDGVKVLLVTNENVLLQYHIEKDNKKELHKETTEYKKIYSEKALKYLKAKEKSVADTLQFHADFQETIDSIIDKFKNDDLSSFKGVLTTPRRSLFRTDITNYREVIVACQKACDIYNFMKKYNIAADSEFKKCVLIGLVNYLQKRLDDPDLKFKANALLDPDLSGDSVYPLMRFCYDYYHSQVITQEAIMKTIAEYSDYIIYVDKTGYDDKDLKVLYSLYISTEEALNTAIQNIYNRLDDISDISLKHYDRIINCLLIVKYDALLNNDKIDEIIEKIISNLKGRGTKYNKAHHLFSSTLAIQDAEGTRKFKEIQDKVFESLNYVPDSIATTDSMNYAEIIVKLSNNNLRQYNPNRIMEKIPLDKIIEHIPDFTSETLDDLRHILLAIDYNELSEETLTSIKQFKDDISSLLTKEDIDLDCIKKLQIRWICDAINRNTEGISE
ncbi:MAG: P-loop NTPase fold protein [Ruminococcus callidus]